MVRNHSARAAASEAERFSKRGVVTRLLDRVQGVTEALHGLQTLAEHGLTLMIGFCFQVPDLGMV